MTWAPLNWSATKISPEFFSVDVKTIDGKPIYHAWTIKKDPPLAGVSPMLASMAGTVDIGAPKRPPIDEVSALRPSAYAGGRVVSRGGATNSPAAVYAPLKYMTG
jgi:glycerol transport system substrate-binding protein